MADFVKPGGHSKGAIRRAGEAIAKGQANAQDEAVVQEWRDCHAYVLNIFQCTLRRWIKDSDFVLVQRLKRLSTIKDKLATGRARDVSSMHDLAGCRIIFPSVQELQAFRDRFHSGTRAAHEYISQGQYDYLTHPKSTGYRGIHDVYRYRVNGGAGSAWNGLKIEIQYRTQRQHAWATAVEISDLLDGERIKFDRGANPDRERLFVLASEHIARLEGMKGYFPDMADAEVARAIKDLEGRLNVFGRLRALNASHVQVPNSKNLVLRFEQNQLTVTPYRSTRKAMIARNQVELEHPDCDVVYIRAEQPHEVAGAFRNYFRDAGEFLGLLPL